MAACVPQQLCNKYSSYTNISFIGSVSLPGIIGVVSGQNSFAVINGKPSASDYDQVKDLQLIPLLVVPFVIPYNAPELVYPLVLSRSILADIWAGLVHKWDDPEIQALNPNAQLPNKTILVCYRQGDSAITTVFTTALSKFSDSWNTSFGTFSLESGFYRSNATLVSTQLDSDMVKKVQKTPYAIGYASLNAVISNSVGFAKLINSHNVSTYPTPPPIQHELIDDVIFDEQFYSSAIDLSGSETYPILSIIYILLRKQTISDCAVATALQNFFCWTLTSDVASGIALKLGYITLPPLLQLSSLKLLLEMECQNTLLRATLLVQGYGPTEDHTLPNMVAKLALSYSESYGKSQTQVTIDPMVSLTVGLQQLQAQEYDYVATSAPVLPTTTFSDEDTFQIVPVLISAVVVATNLPLMDSTVMVWSRDVVVGVFNGTITTWNHPSIRQLNPFVYLPKSPITIFLPANSTETLALFTAALTSFSSGNANASYFKSDASSESLPSWIYSPRFHSRCVLFQTYGELVDKLSDGVASVVVLPYQSAVSNSLTMIALQNKLGETVVPTLSTIANSALLRNLIFGSNFVTDILDTNLVRQAYPITRFLNAVILRNSWSSDCRSRIASLEFFDWVTQNTVALDLVRANNFVPAYNEHVAEATLLAVSRLMCNGMYLITHSTATQASSHVNLVPIIVPIVGGTVLILAIFAIFHWKLRQRLLITYIKLNDAQVALELSDAIATLDLERMAFLEAIENPSPTQRSCLRILKTLKSVKRYVPRGLLFRLREAFDADTSAAAAAAEVREKSSSEGEQVLPYDAPSPSHTLSYSDSNHALLDGTEAACDKAMPRANANVSLEAQIAGRLAGKRASKDKEPNRQGGSSFSPVWLRQMKSSSSLSKDAMDRIITEEVGGSESPRSVHSATSGAAGMNANLASGNHPSPLGKNSLGSPTLQSYQPQLQHPSQQQQQQQPLKRHSSERLGTYRAAASRAAKSVVSSVTQLISTPLEKESIVGESNLDKVVKRAVTVMYAQFMDFNLKLASDAVEALEQYHRFMEEAYPMIEGNNGAIEHITGEALLVHWNAARRSVTARLQACETAVRLLSIAKQCGFQVHIGISSDIAWYAGIGCDAVSFLSVLGTLWDRAHMLANLNHLYQTSILADEGVYQRENPALFLKDMIHVKSVTKLRTKDGASRRRSTHRRSAGSRGIEDVSTHGASAVTSTEGATVGLEQGRAELDNGSDSFEIYELVAEAMVNVTNTEGEWLYAFQQQGSHFRIQQQTQWATCVRNFYSGDFAWASALLKDYISKYDLSESERSLTHQMLNLSIAQFTSSYGPASLVDPRGSPVAGVAVTSTASSTSPSPQRKSINVSHESPRVVHVVDATFKSCFRVELSAGGALAPMALMATNPSASAITTSSHGTSAGTSTGTSYPSPLHHTTKNPRARSVSSNSSSSNSTPTPTQPAQELEVVASVPSSTNSAAADDDAQNNLKG